MYTSFLALCLVREALEIIRKGEIPLAFYVFSESSRAREPIAFVFCVVDGGLQSYSIL